MGTQAQPQSNNSGEEQPTSGQPGEQNSESQSPPIPPISSPAVTPIDTETERQRRYIALLEENQREQNRQIQDLINRQTNNAPPPPPRDAEAERQRFYTEPLEATRAVVRAELQETVRPLVEFVQEMRSGRPQVSAYDRIKGMIKQHPVLGPQITSDIEALVDQFIGQQPASAQITEQLVQSAVVQAIGLKAAGLVPNSNPAPSSNNPPPAPRQGSDVIPPNFRPSAPPMPNNQPRRQPVQLTELQKRLARERGQTDEEYAAWLEVPANEVATSNLGRPRGNGGNQ